MSSPPGPAGWGAGSLARAVEQRDAAHKVGNLLAGLPLLPTSVLDGRSDMNAALRGRQSHA